jgi:hypothetical protein
MGVAPVNKSIATHGIFRKVQHCPSLWALLQPSSGDTLCHRRIWHLSASIASGCPGIKGPVPPPVSMDSRSMEATPLIVNRSIQIKRWHKSQSFSKSSSSSTGGSTKSIHCGSRSSMPTARRYASSGSRLPINAVATCTAPVTQNPEVRICPGRC